MPQKGSLTVVGTGFVAAGDITATAKAHIQRADIVFMVVPDKVSKQWMSTLNDNIVDLTTLYDDGKSRVITYTEMVNALVDAVKSGQKVCAAFYGHPGVFVFAGHQAISQLKKLGYSASMLPGISAEDWLFSDLGIDPAATGCLSVEATQFLFYQRPFDHHALVILWQIGLIGDHTLTLPQTNSYEKGLKVLVKKLSEFYPPQHTVIIYEAATLAMLPPRIEHVTLDKLPFVTLSAASTLVIPPSYEAPFNSKILKELGLTESDIKEPLTID